MKTPLPEGLELETAARPDAAVIWLHGLGADGHDFEPIVPELALPASLRVRFVFPHAPARPVTINMGMMMPAWYDILEMGGRGREDAEGIRGSQALLEGLIAREVARGIPASRIVLAGFSQGGAIVLQTGLRYAQALGGIMALSTYLPLAASVQAEASLANRSVPLFMAHGSQDPVIALGRAQQSREALEALGYAIEWHAYPMPHSVCPQEIADISAWLQKVLGPRP